MSSNLIKQPYEMILDPTGGGGRAKPVANGKFYVGEIDKDPIANPRTDIAYKDESGQERPLTSPLTLNNSGAFVVSKNDGTIIQPYMKDGIGFSVLIQDARGRDVYSSMSTGDPGNITSIVSSENLISNPLFEVKGSVTNPPDSTARNYSAGDELFHGMFAVGNLTGVTYDNGQLSGVGQLYTDVFKSEKQKLSTASYVASIAPSNGLPDESGASFVDNGDYWRVTFDMNNTFSVKLEQGSTATRHDSLSESLNFIAYSQSQIIQIAEEAKDSVITCIGEITIDKAVTIYGGFDASDAKIVYKDGGSITFKEYDSSMTVDLTSSDFDQSKLVDGALNIKDAFNDPSILRNALLSIYSDEVYLVRNDSGSESDVKKESHQHIDIDGNLNYCLCYDFAGAANLTAKLKYLPPKRTVIDFGEIDVQAVNFFSLIRVEKSLCDLKVCFKKNSDPANLTRFITIYSYGCTVDYKGDSCDSVDSSLSRYDIYQEGAVSISLKNPIAPSGFRFLDSNNSRGLTLSGGEVSEIGSHSNTTDVLISGANILGKNLWSGGTASSLIKYENCIVKPPKGSSVFGVRYDYSVLRGGFEVLNTTIDVTGTPETKVYLFDAAENAIYASIQPDRIFYQPKVTFDGIKIISRPDQTIELKKDRDGYQYPANKRLVKPDYSFRNFDLSECKGKLNLTYAVSQYDNATKSIDLYGFENYADRLDLSLGSNTIESNYELKAVKIPMKTTPNVRKITGGVNCKIVATRCNIGDGWDMFSNGAFEGSVFWHKVTYNFTDALSASRFSFLGKYRSATECVFNGYEYLSLEGSKPSIEQFANLSRDNIAISCKTNGYDHTPESKSYSTGGIQRLINQEGEPGNYNGSIESPTPSWNVVVTTERSGLVWEWYDSIGNKRAKKDLPPSDENDGNIIIANPF
ncbi:tailspike protein [Vibrio phage 1.067.O._10N.261.52.C9]|nr:tailspike protein [Vibrio phage 1.067.O._10N.261.52.C9]